MKSIAEIQNDIKDMGMRLGELIRDLEDLKPEDTINTQTDFGKISRLAQQHPIKDHHLEQADNYKKKLYLSVLSAIAQTNNDQREGKLVFLQRIALGMKYEGSIESLVKDGMEIDDKNLDEFVKCMTDNASKQLFVFESLVISNLGGEIDDTAKKYISELSGYLGIGKDEAMFLIKLSVCVLEQSMNKCKQLMNSVPETINILIFINAYLKEFMSGLVFDTKLVYYAYDINADAEMISSIFNKNMGGRKLILEKVRFDLEKNSQNLMIKQCSVVTFEDCDFKGADYPISFSLVNYVQVINCKFVGFKQGVYRCYDECRDMVVERCIFEKCGYGSYYSSSSYGGCFYINKINSFILSNSEFIDCFVGGESESRANGAISYLKEINIFAISNTTFLNCNCSHGNRYYMSRCREGKLFYDLPKQFQKDEYFKNCTITNSANLY